MNTSLSLSRVLSILKKTNENESVSEMNTILQQTNRHVYVSNLTDRSLIKDDTFTKGNIHLFESNCTANSRVGIVVKLLEMWSDCSIFGTIERISRWWIKRSSICSIVLSSLDCRAQFDFTQHARESCDGKCWKSVDLIDSKRWDNHSWHNHSWLFLASTLQYNLKASRRCFSANELVRAAEMGVNTSDGCRQVQRDQRKTREICFCSDQDMCNKTTRKITNEVFLFFIAGIFLLLLSK